MELRGTRKRLQEGVNEPVRKWGFSSIELAFILVLFVLLVLIVMFAVSPFALVFLLPLLLVFRKASEYLKENQKKGIDSPISTRISWGSVPKKISQKTEIDELWK